MIRSPSQIAREFAKQYELSESAEFDLELLLRLKKPLTERRSLPKFRVEWGKGFRI